jgi:hypothetical protein
VEKDAEPVVLEAAEAMAGNAAAARRRMGTKWDGRWQFQARASSFHHAAGTGLVFSVAPTKVLAFGKGTFTHTRHRF